MCRHRLPRQGYFDIRLLLPRVCNVEGCVPTCFVKFACSEGTSNASFGHGPSGELMGYYNNAGVALPCFGYVNVWLISNLRA